MNILTEAYYKRFADNERNLRFWKDYLHNLKSLDFNLFSNKLKVPALVPIGSRILFRGELKHTNEVTVALGADYFVKCSLNQAEVLRHHRINDAQSKLDVYRKEQEYLETQMNFSKTNIFETEGQEIIENYSEKEEKVWREKHRESVRQYKQNTAKEDGTPKEDITDEELWNRLEELELQEELEEELANMDQNVDEEYSAVFNMGDNIQVKHETRYEEDAKEKMDKDTENESKKVTIITPAQTQKFDLIQQVIDRQNNLENKLIELRNRERSETKTEKDLISKLDKMEKLDELEDEMDRLDDLIQNEDVEEYSDDNDSCKSKQLKPERRVSFKDDDHSETLQLTFKHSSIEPENDSYNREKGILKPSDIYEAHSNHFGYETKSILKKSKYDPLDESINIPDNKKVHIKKVVSVIKPEEHETIVIKDVIENEQHHDNKLGNESRPTSLFKKRRMQKTNKSN